MCVVNMVGYCVSVCCQHGRVLCVCVVNMVGYCVSVLLTW